MKISNRTPHDLVIDGVKYPATGSPIRIQMAKPLSIDAESTGIPFPAVFFSIAGPDQVLNVAKEINSDPGNIVLVPRLVMDSLSDYRTTSSQIDRALAKIACPDTGPQSVIRDSNGNIAGVSRVVMHSLAVQRLTKEKATVEEAA